MGFRQRRAARQRGARGGLERLGGSRPRQRPRADVLLLVGYARRFLRPAVGGARRGDGSGVPVSERRAVPVPVRLPGYAECRLRTDERGERVRGGASPRVKPLDDQVREIVNRKTRAWDAQDPELLVSCFHPAMVWPWPPTAQSHDPMTWVMVWGRFEVDCMTSTNFNSLPQTPPLSAERPISPQIPPTSPSCTPTSAPLPRNRRPAPTAWRRSRRRRRRSP